MFCPGVSIAERMCEMFNRYEDGCAAFVSGKTPKEDRDQIFQFYENGQFRILVNVGVTTEGYDCPAIGAVVMARPTQSRALYAQMAGRGMRPFPPSLVNDVAAPEGEEAGERKRLIASSDKPDLLLVDLVGNCSRHKLSSAAAMLGGKYSDRVVLAASESIEADAKAERGDLEVDPMERLEWAATKIAKIEEEERAKRKRKLLKARVDYQTEDVNPFDLFDIVPPVQYAWDKRNPATGKQLKFLSALVQGTCDVHSLKLSKRQARIMIDKLKSRMDAGSCTPKQARWLKRNGHDPHGLSKVEATKLISEIIGD